MRLPDWIAVVVLTTSAILGAVVGLDPAWIIGQLVIAVVIVRTA